jgi:hypothetical protein
MRANLRRAFSVFLLAVLAYGAVTLVSTSNAYADPGTCGGCFPGFPPQCCRHGICICA